MIFQLPIKLKEQNYIYIDGYIKLGGRKFDPFESLA